MILNYPVSKKGETKIFISPNDNNDEQITIISMYFYNDNIDNFIIIPIIDDINFEFIDMSNYIDFFEDCNDCFNIEKNGIMHFDKVEKCENTVDGIIYTLYKDIQELEDYENLNDSIKKILYKYYRYNSFIKINCKLGDNYPLISYKNTFKKELFIPLSENINKIYIINYDKDKLEYNFIDHNKNKFIEKELINFNFPNNIKNFIFYTQYNYFKK